MRRDGAAKMRAIAEEAAVLVKRFKGAFSGEHGDGISRGEWVQWQFGPKLNEALIAIKNAFDPNQLFNPGKIVHTPKMDDQSLFRFSPQYQVIPLKTSLDWFLVQELVKIPLKVLPKQLKCAITTGIAVNLIQGQCVRVTE
jgi:hypothetical protein